MTTEPKKIKDGMNLFERGVKRTFDIIGALLGLILMSPVMLVIYIMQKVESKGPVFFKQERIGKSGKKFYIIKFRTMKMNAEDDGPQLASQNDDRLTSIGKFLRAHHLDEMPQMWNVLIGDMSFVGYRPEREFFIKQIVELRSDYEELYISRPGVTSDATLHNGYTDTMEKMIRRLDMDLEYLQHRNLWVDMKIIAETISSILGGKKF
ncbi:MAG: sugar transferase [Prevotellaceae bacterium]|nr:sugar transferase [Candidatus Colivivens equi]